MPLMKYLYIMKTDKAGVGCFMRGIKTVDLFALGVLADELRPFCCDKFYE